MTRISHAPGGASSISFGDYNLPSPTATPKMAPKPVEAPAAPVAQAPAPVAQAPARMASPFEAIKMQAIASLSHLDSVSPEVEELVTVFLQKLGTSGAQPKAVLSADTSIENLKAVLKGRGTHGIITLGCKFRSMDDNGDNKISFEEFSKAMTEMNMSQPDTHRLFRYFDSDCSGYLSFDELLVGLRGSLTARRLEMVTLAFKVFDKSGDGEISMADLKDRYDASRHPDVILGTKTPEQVLTEFLGVFEAHGGGTKGDGIVTFDEFRKYYESVSASIDLDDYFELVIRNAWHISGGEGWSANTTCKRVLVLHEDGSQSVQEITNDFDVGSAQYLQKLKDQGVMGVKSIALYGEPSDVPEAKGADARSPMPLFPTSPTSTPNTATPNTTGRFAASASKRGGADHFRSSIHFG